MFYQIILSPQVKRNAIISNKHGTRIEPTFLVKGQETRIHL